MKKNQKDYKKLRRLGYCRYTARRAVCGDISHTVRYIGGVSPTELYKTDGNPLYRDSIGTEELKGE